MPIELAAPAFPLRETLTRFFTLDPRSRVPLQEVARLLGTTVETVQDLLRREGVHGRRRSLVWYEAAAYLFDAWPRARILDALGPGFADVIPSEFQLTRVQWSLPIFLVRALDHQAAREWQDDPRLRRALLPNHTHARGIDDYVADLLYAEIRPETLAAFSRDTAFLRAFHYPVLD
jgi:hypothetical protein